MQYKEILKQTPLYGPLRAAKGLVEKATRKKTFKPNLSNFISDNKIQVAGIIHVGANTAQEIDQYAALGEIEVVWIDPIPDMVEQVSAKIKKRNLANHFVLEACCSDKTGERISFNVASNNGESSSMLDLGDHKKLYPEIEYTDTFEIETKTLDDLMNETLPEVQANILVVDTQGADLKVIKGAEKVLENIDAVYIEVSDFPLYEGGATFDEIYKFLTPKGFFCHNIIIKHLGYGDAFFIKNTKKP